MGEGGSICQWENVCKNEIKSGWNSSETMEASIDSPERDKF